MCSTGRKWFDDYKPIHNFILYCSFAITIEGIVARDNGDKMEVICSALDNRVNNPLEHATMCLIDKATGLGDYILTGLEGKIIYS